MTSIYSSDDFRLSSQSSFSVCGVSFSFVAFLSFVFLFFLEGMLTFFGRFQSRDGLVGYDARFTRGRSRVRFPLTVLLFGVY